MAALPATRAGRLHAIVLFALARDKAVASLGARPRWWRPFARAAWDRRRVAIEQAYNDLVKPLWEA